MLKIPVSSSKITNCMPTEPAHSFSGNFLQILTVKTTFTLGFENSASIHSKCITHFTLFILSMHQNKHCDEHFPVASISRHSHRTTYANPLNFSVGILMKIHRPPIGIEAHLLQSISSEYLLAACWVGTAVFAKLVHCFQAVHFSNS